MPFHVVLPGAFKYYYVCAMNDAKLRYGLIGVLVSSLASEAFVKPP